MLYKKFGIIFIFASFIVLFGSEVQALDQKNTSIHQQEYEQYKEKNIESAESTILEQGGYQAENTTPRVQKKVFGYHPYWSGTKYYDYNYELLTTIAYFSLEVNANGDIVEDNNWPNTGLIDLAHQNGVKVVPVVANFNTGSLTSLLSSESTRNELIETLITSVKNADADGVNIDFENVDNSQVNNLASFMQRLSERFHEEIPDSEVTIAVPAIDWYGSYDIESLGAHTDGIVIMGYDYHYAGSDIAGPVAPLTSGTVWPWYNIQETVETYIEESNNQADKLILGLPYYGYDWPTTSAEVPGNTTGRASAKAFNQIKQELNTYTRQWDAESQTPYYTYEGNHQVWYEDEESLGLKYDYVNEQGLGGVGIWALGYDSGNLELWTALEDNFTTPINGKIVTIPAGEEAPLVKILNEQGQVASSFYAYHSGLRGGYQILEDDINNDGINEIITIPGENMGPHIRIFDRQGNVIDDHFVYDELFRGGINVAKGDIDGDGINEFIIAPQSKGGPNVRILTYNKSEQNIKLLDWFWAYEEEFHGGTHIETYDIDNDGKDEIIVSPMKDRVGEIKIFSWNGKKQTIEDVSYYPLGENYIGGLTFRIGKIDQNTNPDIVAAPREEVRANVTINEYANKAFTEISSFDAYGSNFRGGINILLGNFDTKNTNQEIILTPRSYGGPNTRMYQWDTQEGAIKLIDWFWAYQENFRGGVNSLAIDLDEDNQDELVLIPKSGGGPNMRIYNYNETTEIFELENWFWTYASNTRGGVNLSQTQP